MLCFLRGDFFCGLFSTGHYIINLILLRYPIFLWYVFIKFEQETVSYANMTALFCSGVFMKLVFNSRLIHDPHIAKVSCIILQQCYCKVDFDRIIIHEPHNIMMLICPVLFCNGVFVKFGFNRQLIHKPHVLDTWPVLFLQSCFCEVWFWQENHSWNSCQIIFLYTTVLKMGLLRSYEYEIYLLMFFNCVF